MRRALVACLLAFAACGDDVPPAPLVVDAGPPARVSVATLKEVSGDTQLERDGTRAKAVLGALYEGDVLSTGADGHALLISKGREVELLERSSLRIAATLADLSTSAGELTFETLESEEVQTTSGSAKAQAGSRVKLEMRDGGAPTFFVASGSLEFIDEFDAGASTTVKAGQRYVVGGGTLELDAPVTSPSSAKPTMSLTPRGAVTLKPKTGPAVRLPAGTSAVEGLNSFTVDRSGKLEASARGTMLQLEGGSKGTLEPRAGDPAIRATLQQGAMRVFLKAGQSVLVDGKKPLVLRAKTELTALVTPGKSGPRVELLGGDGETTLGEALPRNLEVVKRSATLTLPAGRSERVFWGRGSDVSLQFPPGDGVMELASDPEFTNLLIAAQGKDALVVPAPLSGALYWRRKGNDTVSSARFERDASAATVTAKSDTVAETGLKATVYFQGAVPSLTFTFPPRDGASAWRFRVYDAKDLKTPIVERKVSENRALVESGLLREGSYLWSAVALDKSGAEQPGGRMNKMDVLFDNSVTRLVLTAPREGERGALATGIAPLGSKLTMNGKSVPLDASGRFSVPVRQARVLIFKLTTREGSEAQWVRRLR